MVERVRLVETFRNLFYTPIYVAVAGGFLYREGLNVLFSTAPGDRSPIAMLGDGTADIVQSGISRSLMALDEGQDDAPLHFAEINQRDGFFLVSRGPAESWTWKDLEGSRLIPVGFTPVPWTSLRSAMRTNGVDLDRVRLIEGLSAEESIENFRAGEADYVHLPHPQAQQLIDEGAGHLATAVGPNARVRLLQLLRGSASLPGEPARDRRAVRPGRLRGPAVARVERRRGCWVNDRILLPRHGTHWTRAWHTGVQRAADVGG